MIDSGTAIVKEKLMEVMKLLEEDVDTINVLESNLEKGKRKASDYSNHDNLVHESSVLNPSIVRTKGLTNVRLKSNLEMRKRKVTKGASMAEFGSPNASQLDQTRFSKLQERRGIFVFLLQLLQFYKQFGCTWRVFEGRNLSLSVF
ncbi:hypothetical protein LWI29_031264 [Acer saccharum]|uniref:Uncharacterized protein n=1 Tax=Acer saccharum TaxID=4024 RepID=A0AA39T7I9_ACESA|nr:hypothetical protein LWI29_031264 [Acer saccharum]